MSKLQAFLELCDKRFRGVCPIAKRYLKGYARWECEDCNDVYAFCPKALYVLTDLEKEYAQAYYHYVTACD